MDGHFKVNINDAHAEAGRYRQVAAQHVDEADGAHNLMMRTVSGDWFGEDAQAAMAQASHDRNQVVGYTEGLQRNGGSLDNAGYTAADTVQSAARLFGRG